ncbi:hypothetical protein [Actinokineospora enzanensis]|uniref:hypothetical protein n=1 Tax=Actinokineospora enzanensis TaxID=155975 RepID=UPI0003736260|nr:hypothetical protein [Actinokineospora enzanensis]
MKLRILGALGALVAGIGVGFLVPPGVASADAVPQQVRQVVSHLEANGRLSAADRATLARYPAYASRIIDPEATTYRQEVIPADGTTKAMVLGGPGCWIGNRSIDGHYATGGVAYTYTYRVDWCENSSAVTSVHYRNHTISLGTFMEQGSVVEDWVTPVPSYNVQTKRKIEVKNCIPVIGCVHTEYPYATWYLTANPRVEDYALAGIEGT